METQKSPEVIARIARREKEKSENDRLVDEAISETNEQIRKRGYPERKN